jgi:hypothetical protein
VVQTRNKEDLSYNNSSACQEKEVGNKARENNGTRVQGDRVSRKWESSVVTNGRGSGEVR